MSRSVIRPLLVPALTLSLPGSEAAIADEPAHEIDAAEAQSFQPAMLDLEALWAELTDEANGTAPTVGTGANGWSGGDWGEENGT